MKRPRVALAMLPAAAFALWMALFGRLAAAEESESRPRVELLEDDEAWSRLPPLDRPHLPNWARALAGSLPRTTAAMLELDYLYRTSTEIDPRLRARMRWTAAQANRCGYATAYAEADLLRAGGTPEEVQQLASGQAALSAAERKALAFARTMTLAASEVTDREIEELIAAFGERTVVAMVLQMAYANFQDRLVLALGLDVEPGGPLPPLEVHFAAADPNQKPEPAARPDLPENAPTDGPVTVDD